VGYVPDLPPGTGNFDGSTTTTTTSTSSSSSAAAASSSASTATALDPSSLSREAWVARAAFSVPIAVDGSLKQLVVRKGQEVQTAAANFCRLHSVYQTAEGSGSNGVDKGATTAGECWRLVPLLFDRLLAANELADAEGPGGGDDDAGVALPLATLSSPVKGYQLGRDETVTVEVALSNSSNNSSKVGVGGRQGHQDGQARASAPFCCLFLNNAPTSSWCGAVSSPAGKPVVVGGVSIASTGGFSGPHVLQLVCRPARVDLESLLSKKNSDGAQYALVADDAAFFAFI